MAKNIATTPVSSRNAKNLKTNGSAAGGLTLSEVYDMTADVGKHMQSIASEYGAQLLEPLAELVIRALEHLEWFVEENERMRTVNCKLLLEADQMAAERNSKKELESEVAGLQLVLMERGRQRDALACRIAELESAQSEALATDRRKTTDFSRPLSFTDDYGLLRTSTLPHKSRSSHHKESTQKDLFIKQLQRDLARERKKLLDMESSLIDYQRVQQHTEKEIMDLRKDYAIAIARIKRLEEERTALMERSEVVDDLRAMRLSSATRQDESSSDSVPKFYKKDLMMIIQERNELKEKVSALMEELTSLKTNYKWYGSGGSSSVPEGMFSPASEHSRVSPVTGIREMLEGSLVIFDVQHSLSNGEARGEASYLPDSADFEETIDGIGSATPNPSDVETSV